MADDSSVIQQINQAAHPLTGAKQDYDPLLTMIGDARVVLIGEASHGTHEFYEQRAKITKRLIQEKGFTIVAVEADWPDAYRINRYVRGLSRDRSAQNALADFTRFPLWMWRNTVVEEFVEWLRDWNDQRAAGQAKAGFYGVDLYSLYRSMEAVLAYLDEVDPEAAARARYRYSCFEHFGEDSQAYGYAASFGLTEACESGAISQLMELRRQTGQRFANSDPSALDEHFYAEQNARLVKNAEQYYRSMFQGNTLSWNLRDRHMAETLDQLIHHFAQGDTPPKVVVWEHNSHLGDARYTESGRQGQLNVGQLVREQYGDQARLIGFSTHTGSVTAASNWDEPAQRKRVRPSLPGSYENLLHQANDPNFYLLLRGGGALAESLRRPRLERAIGVIYRPETERVSHYFHAHLSEQFDAIIHLDETHALEPLERPSEWEAAEGVPETFPFAL